MPRRDRFSAGLHETATRRGKPDHGGLRHLREEAPVGGERDARPACRHAGYHIFWTAYARMVNCPKCKETPLYASVAEEQGYKPKTPAGVVRTTNPTT